MKFGFAFIPSMPAREVVKVAQMAEELGYDRLHLPDQTFHRDPFVLLGLCAQATSRIGLGLMVTNPFTRHPVQIARAAGLLAEVAEGRFILGLGTGNRPRVLHGLGIDPSPAPQRLRESIEVIRALLRGESVTWRSPWLTLNKVSLDYRPAHPVPIHVGTRGPLILSLAGEVADGVVMEGLFSEGGLSFALQRVREGAETAGREVTELDTTAWQAVTITEDEEAAGDLRMRNWAALLIRTTQPRVLRAIGISEEVAQAVHEDAAAHGDDGAGRRVAAADVKKLLMIGTPGELRAHVERLEACGVSAITPIALGDLTQVQTMLERFASDVMRAA